MRRTDLHEIKFQNLKYKKKLSKIRIDITA